MTTTASPDQEVAAVRTSCDAVASALLSVTGIILPPAAYMVGIYHEIVKGLLLSVISMQIAFAFTLLALFFGVRALRKIRKSEGALRGRRWAVAGVATCLVGTIISVVVVEELQYKRRACCGDTVVDALLRYHEAQKIYRDKYKEFAKIHTDLVDEGLLHHHFDWELRTAKGIGRYRGYYFTTVENIEGVPVDHASRNGLCAAPFEGKEVTFVILETGRVYSRNTRGEPVTDFPADSKAAGWVEVDL